MNPEKSPYMQLDFTPKPDNTKMFRKFIKKHRPRKSKKGRK